MAHAWESWSDARAYDGVATILQPQALPLYDGIDIHTMLALFAGPIPASPLDIVTRLQSPMAKDFAGTWREALAHGVISNTASPKVDARLRATRRAYAAGAAQSSDDDPFPPRSIYLGWALRR